MVVLDPSRKGPADMPLIDRPWERVRQPAALPDPLSAPDLLDMPEDAFAHLIRSQLVPRDHTGAGRRAWARFWDVLRSDDLLTNRVYDVLDEFLDTTEESVASQALETREAARARKFLLQCRQAWDRIDREHEPGSLSWAGSAGNFQPAARRVIAILVAAIARHRAAVYRAQRPTPDDRHLWAVLRHVDLDPEDYPTEQRPGSEQE